MCNLKIPAAAPEYVQGILMTNLLAPLAVCNPGTQCQMLFLLWWTVMQLFLCTSACPGYRKKRKYFINFNLLTQSVVDS